MSTKRNFSTVPDAPPPPSNKRSKSRLFVDPSVVLQGLDQPDMTSEQAVLWVREMMETALALQPESEPKKPKVCVSLSTSS